MPAITTEPTKLRGEIISFNQRAADGWGTGQLLAGKRKSTGADFANNRELVGDNETVTIAGKLIGARVGDTVELDGNWTRHERYGNQFKFKSCTSLRPDGPDGAVRWMASRFPDVGERRAREFVERFGEQLWDVIEKQPERLTEVNGITPVRAAAISAAYKLIAGEREHMVKLRGWGLTDNQVARCLERWDNLDQVVAELVRNPYLLGQEIFGFGFIKADVIARNMGTKLDSPERIRAGVEHTVGEAAQAGHCYLPGKALQREAAKLLQVEEGLVGPAIRDAAKAGRLVRRGWRVYARRMDVAEERLARCLVKMLGLSGNEQASNASANASRDGAAA